MPPGYTQQLVQLWLVKTGTLQYHYIWNKTENINAAIPLQLQHHEQLSIYNSIQHEHQQQHELTAIEWTPAATRIAPTSWSYYNKNCCNKMILPQQVKTNWILCIKKNVIFITTETLNFAEENLIVPWIVWGYYSTVHILYCT